MLIDAIHPSSRGRVFGLILDPEGTSFVLWSLLLIAEGTVSASISKLFKKSKLFVARWTREHTHTHTPAAPPHFYMLLII